jgi:transcriptional regulator of aromatic amino acid metabolism
MKNILAFFELFLSNPFVIFIVEWCALATKTYLLVHIIKLLFQQKPQRLTWLLVLVLTGGIVEDVTWLLKISREYFFTDIHYTVMVMAVRIAWICFILSWHSLGLLLETLVEPNKPIARHQKFLMTITASFILSFLYCIIRQPVVQAASDRLPFEHMLIMTSVWYAGLVILPSLGRTLCRLRSTTLPKILKQQLIILLQYIIAPLVITLVYNITTAQPARYAFNTFYEILLTTAIYYAAHKMRTIRFLNVREYVIDTQKKRTNEPIKEMLEQLAGVASLSELATVAKSFFNRTFNIPLSNIHVFFRATATSSINAHKTTPLEQKIEFFFSHKLTDQSYAYLQKTNLLIFDELAFNAYNNNDHHAQEFVDFLQTINADLLIPIYHHRAHSIGYIFIEQNSRHNKLYSDIERNEIVMFAQFMAQVAVILQNNHIESIVAAQKELKEELYHKHQEISQYKESIRSFLANVDQREIGILFYKNRSFLFANQAAKDMLAINPNVQEGHPLAKALNQIVKGVQAYQTAQTCFSRNDQGNRVMLTALANLQAQNIIILVRYPDIAHVLKQQIDLLDNPSEWDYLLYLETTQSGQLINQLIPGNTSTLLTLKIKLLKAALSKKTLYIVAPEADLETLAEFVYTLSLRTTLFKLTLTTPTNHASIMCTLFGMNHLLGNTVEQPLMEKLNKTGTLFIQNIHHLDLETQKHVVHYATYGSYSPYKSDYQCTSDVRIMCSTTHNLETLVQENKLLPALYDILKTTSFTLPSMIALSEEDLTELATGFAQQTLDNSTFKNLFELTTKEKQKLIAKKSVSLYDFKRHVQQILESKSQKTHIESSALHATTTVPDPELMQAARLGRHALKDASTMTFLWNKFKNQNKIATFLGVNRSSVNRRCKDFKLS